MLYAHSRKGAGMDSWEPLEQHLQNVARTAGSNASAFGASPIGEIAGWLHDLGKVKPGFQAKLRSEKNDTPHSGEAARHAAEVFPGLGRIMAYCIAGHHAGCDS